MKKLKWMLLVFMFMGIGIARADETAIQVALWNPIQTSNQDYYVGGLRLDFIYGVNDDVRGLDLGIINKTTGEEDGVQFGTLNLVDGHFYGWQEGAVNIVGGDFVGLQEGYVNSVNGNFCGVQDGLVNMTKGNFKGVQLGVLWNSADEGMQGLQVGLINTASTLDGVQIGLLNFNKSKIPLGFFPIVNAAF